MGLWRRFLGLAFRLLYNEFAWTYDWVSWAVSKGRWRRWQQAALPRLNGWRVLEIGFGTGNLLAEMGAQGYRCYGVDPSPHMIKIAAAKLRRKQVAVHLCRARAQELPFRNKAFDSIVVTFPAGFIADAKALREMRETLAPRGRLIVVDGGRLLGSDPWSVLTTWALNLTGGRETTSEVKNLFQEVGFIVRQEIEMDGLSTVQVLVAYKG